MSLLPDQILQGRYRIQVLLHQGGMGAVYRASDQALNCTVAIKERIPDPHASEEALAQARLQFQREAQTLASLSHPNLPRVTNYFSLDGNEYLVMDFVEGQSLDALLAQYGFIAPDTVTNWTNQLLDALTYIHNSSVIHRDIKPSNIVFKLNGLVVLVDFGLAKLVDITDPHTLIALRGMGTPGYSPLEQYAGETSHTDARSDIYSLGATLYHLLTGRAPLPVHERLADPHAQPAPRTLNPAIKPEMEAVVVKAMEIDPQDRFQTAAQMRQALEPQTVLLPTQGESFGPVIVAHTGQRPAPYTVPIPAAVPKQRKLDRLWLAIAAAVILGVCGGSIGLYAVLNSAGLSGLFSASNTRPTSIPRPTSVLVHALETVVPTSPILTSVSVRAGDTPTIIERPPTPAPLPTLPPPTAMPILPPPSSEVPSPDRMVLIPAGDFWMGKVATDSSAAADESPGHSVFVSAFWIDKYEVSNGQYQKCVEAGRCQKPVGVFAAQSPNEAYGKPGMEDFPVVTLSDFMAADYCKWVGRRLPYEAEWEKAARGTTDWIFPWGNQWDGYRANAGKNEPGPEEVTAYPNGCSPFGVCNMAGNVAEWIADNYSSTWYRDSMTSNLLRDPAFWNSLGQFNVRGGSFRSPIGDVRVSKRSSANGDNAKMNYVGFRCVKEAH